MKRPARSPAPAKRSRPPRAATAASVPAPADRKPRSAENSDARITQAICERLSRPVEDLELADLANEHLDVSDVRVSVEGGRVILEGTVPERRMKPAIEALVDACPGVQDIDNRLRVRP